MIRAAVVLVVLVLVALGVQVALASPLASRCHHAEPPTTSSRWAGRPRADVIDERGVWCGYLDHSGQVVGASLVEPSELALRESASRRQEMEALRRLRAKQDAIRLAADADAARRLGLGDDADQLDDAAAEALARSRR